MDICKKKKTKKKKKLWEILFKMILVCSLYRSLDVEDQRLGSVYSNELHADMSKVLV